MTSYFRAQKRGAFFLGLGTAGALYLFAKREVVNSTIAVSESLPGTPVDLPSHPISIPELVLPEQFVGPSIRAFKTKWNETIDTGAKAIISTLADRNL